MKAGICLMTILLVSLLCQINIAEAQNEHMHATTAPPVMCWIEVEGQSNKIITAENSSKAITLAEASKEFKEKTAGFSPYFMYIMVGWMHDKNCNLTSEMGLAVYYELDNVKSFDHDIAIVVDPSLTKIINSIQYVHSNDTVLWVNDRNVKGDFAHSLLPEFSFALPVLVISISLLTLMTFRTRLRFLN